jgi:CBS domain-containing protein
MNRTIQANTRTVQDLFRLANPGEVFAVHQRLVEQYVKGLVETSAEFLRVTNRLTADALQPLEQHMANGGHDRRSNGRVADVMTSAPEVASPSQSVQDVARVMAERDIGAIPVGENDRLVGMITDRDIAVRVTAAGKDPQATRVREIMTPEVRYCYEDEDVEHVAENMSEQQIRRLPVVDRRKRLVGIVSIGDLAMDQPTRISGRALRGVSRPGGQHTQAAHAGNKPNPIG